MIRHVLDQKSVSMSCTALLTATAALTGERFFRELTAGLASVPGVDAALVAAYASASDRGHLRLVSASPRHKAPQTEPWPIRNTPIALLKSVETVFYADGVATEFPRDEWLKDNGLRGFLGMRIPSTDGTGLGVLLVVSRSPLRRSRSLLATLQTLAGRAGIELERMKVAGDERLSHKQLARAFAAAEAPMIVAERASGKIIHVNRACENLLGYRQDELLGTRLNHAPFWGESKASAPLLENLGAAGNSGDCELALVGGLGRVRLSVQPLEAGADHMLVTLRPVDVPVAAAAPAPLAGALRENRLLMDANPDGVFIASAGRIVYANSALVNLLGRDRERLVGETMARLFSLPSQPGAPDFDALFKKRDVCSYKLKLPRSRVAGVDSGALTLRRIETEHGPQIVGVVRAAQRQMVAKPDAESIELGTLSGRAEFMVKLRHALHRSDRRNRHNFAVLFLDIDRFRLVNHAYGQRFGDALLEAIAVRLHDALRPLDEIARNGGDEFWVLLQGVGDRGDAIAVADRLHHQLTEPFEIDSRKVFVSASIGIAMSHDSYQEPEELMRDADTAMYAAKNEGQSGYAVFKERMRAPFEAQLALEAEVREAVAENQFELHYQPMIDLATQQPTGFEALLRWRHPRRGLLAPAEFLEVANRTGLIIPIGWWALETACTQLYAWQHLDEKWRELTVGVNLANRQFSQWVLPQRVARVLELSGIRGQSLHFELSCGDLVGETGIADEILHRLKTLGIGLQLDDFGLGHSTLTSLRQFPLDAIKVDGVFVRNMSGDPRDAALVNHIASLARSLGLKLVAGGVENRAQADRLRALGCGTAQGYFYAKPMPAEAVPSYLARQRAASAIDTLNARAGSR